MRKLLEHFFSTHCILCELSHTGKTIICDACLQTLPKHIPGCTRCAQNIATNTQRDFLCAHCANNPPAFDRTFALFDYATPMSNFIWRLKFGGDLSIANLFANQWIDFFTEKTQEKNLPQCIIPMPLHPTRLKERGFNQALEIAKPIGHYFYIPIDTKTCVRIKHTEAQSTLPLHQRKNNVNNAFGLSHSIQAKHVAIVDDVMTTGNTVSEISHLLKKAGVEKVDVWCCARA